MARKRDARTIEKHTGSGYPAPWAALARMREKRALGDAFGLTQYGVNLVRLPSGEWSSQRHWHSHEDEFVYVLQGELTMVSEDGEDTVRAGDCVGFPAGKADGHCFINRSAGDAVYLEIGTRSDADTVTYPDIDLHLPAGSGFTHKNGTPY